MPRCRSAGRRRGRGGAQPTPTSPSPQARYAEAQLGPTAEERALADATVAAAEAARDVVEARAAEDAAARARRREIAIVVAEIGEAVVPGEPVLTLVPDDGIWFGFNLREDALRDLAIGASRSGSLCRQCHDSRREVGRTAQPGRIRSLAGGARDRRPRPQHVLSAPGSNWCRAGSDAGSDTVAGSVMHRVDQARPWGRALVKRRDPFQRDAP